MTSARLNCPTLRGCGVMEKWSLAARYSPTHRRRHCHCINWNCSWSQHEPIWMYTKLYNITFQSVQWRRSEAASNEIHFRSKVRTVKAATCPKILCCAPCAPPWTIATTATVAILWPGAHNTHKTQQDAVLLCLATWTAPQSRPGPRMGFICGEIQGRPN